MVEMRRMTMAAALFRQRQAPQGPEVELGEGRRQPGKRPVEGEYISPQLLVPRVRNPAGKVSPATEPGSDSDELPYDYLLSADVEHDQVGDRHPDLAVGRVRLHGGAERHRPDVGQVPLYPFGEAAGDLLVWGACQQGSRLLAAVGNGGPGQAWHLRWAYGSRDSWTAE